MPSPCRLRLNNPRRRRSSRRSTSLLSADNAGAARRGEVPLLGGDPFVDAQDWEITKLAIAVVPSGTTAATATVTFANQGKATRLLIELEQTPAGWRIADIKATSGSLRALYKLRP